MITLDSPVTVLKGVGDAKAKALEKAGIRTVRDLARHYPRAYQNRGDVKTVSRAAAISREAEVPAPCSLMLTVATEPKTANIRRGMSLTKFRAFDESGTVEITYFNQPFMKNVFRVGGEYRFWGGLQMSAGKATMSNPVSEPVSENVPLLPIVPVYPLSAGLSQKFLAGLVKEAVRVASVETAEHIPSEILRENGLCTAGYALRTIHFPPDTESLAAARKRLAFDEIFTLAIAMSSEKSGKDSAGAHPCPDTDVSALLSCLPFGLTGAQKRSIAEISADMRKEAPMCRILCGDVGSGKTAVAAAAAYIAVKNGTRCAIMAPTEILAKQHYADLSALFEKVGMRTALLCGSMTAAEKKKVRESIKGDGADVVVGTHALLSAQGDKAVLQSWHFGPALITESGEARTDFSGVFDRYIFMGTLQPRAGIGYYEPGHYCMIVAEGRGASVGVRMDQFAELFAREGCTLAYNLDGGRTAVLGFNSARFSVQSNRATRLQNDIVYFTDVPPAAVGEEERHG